MSKIPLLPASINKHQTQQQSMRKFSPKKKDFSSPLFGCCIFVVCQNISHHHYLNPTFPSLHLFIHFSPECSMHHSSVCLLRAFPVFPRFERCFLGKINENQSSGKKSTKALKENIMCVGMCCVVYEIIVVGFIFFDYYYGGRWTMWLS